MSRRQQLIDMINGGSGADGRKLYEPVYTVPPPASWEEYDEESFLSFDFDGSLERWNKPSDEWLLTPEQAAQLGPIRGNKILLQDGYMDKLRGWKLIK